MNTWTERTPKITVIYRGQGGSRGLMTPSVQTRRVAAYCRVSTLLDTQALSLETQMDAFRQKIREHPGWKLVDVYADEGVTGTSVQRRRAFRRMIADCEAGRIDYIITKSISRFARNTLECINCVRYLKGLGVHILFEKENLDTGREQSEMILTVLAGFAQEESHSISENVKWGIRKKFEKGGARWCSCYGFRKAADGRMCIHPGEAAVVRRIFRLYEQGASLQQIADLLNREHLPTPRGKTWRAASLSQMLDNEKYKGDVLLQKFVSVDHLTHRSVVNDATEVPSYYISEHHQPIVSARTFARVQTIRALRDNHGGHIPQYPCGGMDIRCPLCGSSLIQRNTRGHAGRRMALGCFTAEGCGGFALRMHLFSAALLEAYAGVEASTLPDTGAGAFRALKQAHPRMDSVEYYWLDELVASVRLTECREDSQPAWTMTVLWKCGLTSAVNIPIPSPASDPAALARQFFVNEEKYRAGKGAKA